LSGFIRTWVSTLYKAENCPNNPEGFIELPIPKAVADKDGNQMMEWG